MNDPIPATRAVIEQGIAAGLHIGAQVYVSIDGGPVADLALGQSRPGVPMTPDTLMLWLSGSKAVGAVAIAQLWERGKLSLDDPVARHIPEFGQKGKEPITIRHILTHTAGFRWVETDWPAASWEQVIARICQAPQERGWVAGKKAGYSPYTSWFILGEIVRRLDGRDYDRYVREEIFLPLGMKDSWIAVPTDRYRVYGDRIGIMQKTDAEGSPLDAGLDTEWSSGASRPAGGGRGPARELGRFYEMLLGMPLAASQISNADTPIVDWPASSIRDADTPIVDWPASSIRDAGTPIVGRSAVSIRDADTPIVDPPASFIRDAGTPIVGQSAFPTCDAASGATRSVPNPQHQLSTRRKPRILLPQTIEALVARHRTGMKDLTFNHVMDWGLGFLVNSAIYGPESVPYGFGPHASARAYGHGGSQSSASFADPEHGLAVVVICNGMPGEPAHQKRMREILTAIYEDLGFAGNDQDE